MKSVCKRKFKKLYFNILTMANFFTKYFGVFRNAKPYSLYVLLVLYLTYMLNQLDRYALSITSIIILFVHNINDYSKNIYE